jgi:hypothetical protein
VVFSELPPEYQLVRSAGAYICRSAVDMAMQLSCSRSPTSSTCCLPSLWLVGAGADRANDDNYKAIRCGRFLFGWYEPDDSLVDSDGLAPSLVDSDGLALSMLILPLTDNQQQLVG